MTLLLLIAADIITCKQHQPVVDVSDVIIVAVNASFQSRLLNDVVVAVTDSSSLCTQVKQN